MGQIEHWYAMQMIARTTMSSDDAWHCVRLRGHETWRFNASWPTCEMGLGALIRIQHDQPDIAMIIGDLISGARSLLGSRHAEVMVKVRSYQRHLELRPRRWLGFNSAKVMQWKNMEQDLRRYLNDAMVTWIGCLRPCRMHAWMQWLPDLDEENDG